MPVRPTLSEDFNTIMNGNTRHSGNSGNNGNNDQNSEDRQRNVAHDWTDSEDDSDVEEAEPVMASLVLKIVSEPTTPRKSSYGRKNGDIGDDDGYASLGDARQNETYLQVAVQRSTSSSSVHKQSQSRSRHPSTGSQFGLNRSSSYSSHNNGHNPYDSFDSMDHDRQIVLRQPSTTTSRDGSLSPTSLYGEFDLDIQRPNGVNTVEFLSSVNRHTKMMQSGVRELRSEIDNPMKVLDIGQEAIILSGLNKQATDSLKNIKNLYDETKYLKSYLEKMEAKIHYDISMRRKTPERPSLLRRAAFLGLVGGTIGYILYKRNPEAFLEKLDEAAAVMENIKDEVLFFFTKDTSIMQTTLVGLDRDS